MLAFVGDLHADVATFLDIVREVAKYPDIKAVIQVGDFGFGPQAMKFFRNKKNWLPIPVYAIDGNHEHFDWLGSCTDTGDVLGIAPNLYYVPRGTVLELDGRRVAFMGGAASVDKELRLRRKWVWHEEENITPAQVAKFDGVAAPDIFVAHTPPWEVVQRNFSQLNLLMFGLPTTWRDPNAAIIQTLWERWDRPPLICGHFHKHIVDGTCRILDIYELYCM